MSPEALAAFAVVRLRLVESIGVLWMDMHALQIRTRDIACQAFVASMERVTDQVPLLMSFVAHK